MKNTTKLYGHVNVSSWRQILYQFHSQKLYLKLWGNTSYSHQCKLSSNGSTYVEHNSGTCFVNYQSTQAMYIRQSQESRIKTVDVVYRYNLVQNFTLGSRKESGGFVPPSNLARSGRRATSQIGNQVSDSSGMYRPQNAYNLLRLELQVCLLM